MMTILKLVTTLEKLQDKTLRVKGVIPSLGLSFDKNLVGNGFNSTKAILMLMRDPTGLPSHIGNNTNHSLLPQMKTFTDEEGEDDPIGEICWDKEVLLSFDERHEDTSVTVHHYPIDAIEIADDAFRLIAGNELVDLRIEEPPFEEKSNQWSLS